MYEHESTCLVLKEDLLQHWQALPGQYVSRSLVSTLVEAYTPPQLSSIEGHKVTSMCQQLSPCTAEVYGHQRTIPGLDWAPALASLPARAEWSTWHRVWSGSVCLCVCVFVLRCVPLFVTPWTIACQVPLSVEVFRQEYWGGLSFPTLVDLPDPRIETESFASPVFADDSLPLHHLETWVKISTLTPTVLWPWSVS